MRYVAVPEIAFTRTIQFISRRAAELQAELSAATDLLDNLAAAKQESDARLTRVHTNNNGNTEAAISRE